MILRLLPDSVVALGLSLLAGFSLVAQERFRWSGLPSIARDTTPFPATLEQIPGPGSGGFFEGEIELGFFQPAPEVSLVFSEFLPGTGEVELVNGGRKTVTFDGRIEAYLLQQGTVVLTGIQRFDVQGTNGAVTLAPGERVWIGVRRPTGYAGHFRRIQPNLNSILGNRPAALSLFSAERPLDLWVGPAHAGEGIALNMELPVPLWEGVGATELPNPPMRFRRVGSARTRSAMDWEVVREVSNLPAADLRLPLFAVDRRIAVEPSKVRLEDGRWSGHLSVAVSATGVLRADNLAGHPVESGSLTVQPGPRLSLAWNGTNHVSEAGNPLKLELRLSEPSPAELTVQLFADPAGELMVPATVVIPAGLDRLEVDLVPLDDGQVDGSREVRISAVADGHRSSGTAQARVDDSSGVGVTLHLPARVEINHAAVQKSASYPFEIVLDRPADRDVLVPLGVELIQPRLDAPPGTGGPEVFPVSIARGTTRSTITNRAYLGDRHFPARYRISHLMPGWQGTPAEIEVVPVGFPGVLQLEAFPVVEGDGLTNALRITLPGLLAEPFPVTLQSTPHPLVRIPEQIIVPPFTRWVEVPVEIGDNTTDDGAVIVAVAAIPPPGSAMAATSSRNLFIDDNDPGRATLQFTGIPFGQFPVITSGTTNRASLQFYSGPTNIGRLTYFNGPVQISLAADGQALTYTGPAVIEHRHLDPGGFPMVMTGAGWNVRLRLGLPDGREVWTSPFDVSPADALTDPADLGLQVPIHWALPTGTTADIPVVITNRGPATVPRVGLTATITGPADFGEGTHLILGTGPLAAGESRTIRLPIRSGGPGLGSVTLSLISDPFDPDATDNQAVISLAVTNLPVAGRREIVVASSDLAYSAARERFYVSTRAPEIPGVLELDPFTGNPGRHWSLPTEPGLLSITSDGQQLYALLNGGTEMVRLDLSNGTTNLHFLLQAVAIDFCAVPTSESQTAVMLHGLGVQLFDNSVRRGQPLSDHVWLEPDLRLPQLAGYSGNIHFYQAGSGQLSRNGLGSGFYPAAGPAGGFRLLNRRMYFADGSSAGVHGTPFTPWNVPNGVDVCLDPDRGRIYYAVQRGNLTELIARSFDGEEVGRQMVPSVAGQLTRLTRWGERGLAFLSTSGQVLFLDSPLVPDDSTQDLAIRLASLPPEKASEPVELQITNSSTGRAAGIRVHLAWSQPGGLDLTGLDVETAHDNAAVIRLPDLAPQSQQTVHLPFVPASPGLRWIKAVVAASGTDARPDDNASSLVWTGNLLPGQELDLTVNDLAYEDTRRNWMLAVSAVGSEPVPGLLMVDSENGLPGRWYPLRHPVEALKLSEDGTVVGLLSNGRNRVQRLSLHTGAVDVSFSVGDQVSVADWMIPDGRPDRLILSRNRTDRSPAYLDVALYEMGVRKGAASTRPAGVLAPTAQPGEFLGGNAEGESNRFHRYRWNDDGITWLGLTEAIYHPHSRQFLRVGDRFIGNGGDIHQLTDGAWTDSLPLAPFTQGLAVNPTMETVVTVPPFTVWDLNHLRISGERPVTELASANRVTVAANGNALLGSSVEPGVIFVAATEPQRAQLSARWETATNNVMVGQVFPTWITISNAGPSVARGVSLPLMMFPVEAVRWETDSTAQLGSTINGTPQITISELPPGTSVRGRLDLRGVGGQLLPLNATPTTSTYQSGEIPWYGPAVLIRPLAVDPFRPFGGPVGDIAVDTTRNQLWIAVASHPYLAVIDLDTFTLTGTVPLGFTPQRIFVTDDGRFLYAVPTRGPITRIDLASRQVDLTIPLSVFHPGDVEWTDLVPMPGKGSRYAVSLRIGNHLAGIWVAEDATPQAAFLPDPSGPVANYGNMAFAGTDRLLITFGSTLHRLRLEPPQLTLEASFPALAPAGYPWLTARGDLAYFHGGRIVNVNDGAIVRDHPGTSHLIPDPTRGRIMTASALGQVRIVQGLDAASGELLWSTAANGQILNFDSSNTHLVMRTRLADNYGIIWLLPLQDLTEPAARIQFTGTWNPPRVPQNYSSELTLTLSNAAPWIARRVAIQLPDDFDPSFTNIVVQSGNVPNPTATRHGSQLILPELPASGVVHVRIKAAGRPSAGTFAPDFTLAESTPPLSLPASAASPLQVVTAPDLSLHPATVTEGDTTVVPARVRISLSTPAVVPTVIRFQAIPGTANSTDYNPPTAQVTLQPGATEGIVNVGIRNDLIPEPTKHFTVRVIECIGARVLQPEATVTILDNDWPAATASHASVMEGHDGLQWVQVTLQLAAPPLEPVRIGYATVSGSAAAGEDFRPVQGTLTLAPGQTQAVLSVAVMGDRQPEPDEDFRLIWFAPDGVRPPNDATVLILNDDAVAEFRVGLPAVAATVRVVVFSDRGSTYRLERVPAPDAPWETIGPSIPGTGALLTLEDPQPPATSALYRVVREP